MGLLVLPCLDSPEMAGVGCAELDIPRHIAEGASQDSRNTPEPFQEAGGLTLATRPGLRGWTPLMEQRDPIEDLLVERAHVRPQLIDFPGERRHFEARCGQSQAQISNLAAQAVDLAPQLDACARDLVPDGRKSILHLGPELQKLRLEIPRAHGKIRDHAGQRDERLDSLFELFHAFHDGLRRHDIELLPPRLSRQQIRLLRSPCRDDDAIVGARGQPSRSDGATPPTDLGVDVDRPQHPRPAPHGRPQPSRGERQRSVNGAERYFHSKI